jgi:hypothetical protein
MANVLRDGTLEWHPEDVSLSRLLEMMVYLQTASGLITALDGDGFLTAAARTAEGFARLERDLGFHAM